MGIEVRVTAGVPVAANFALLGSAPANTPLIVNTLTGVVYYLAAGDVVTPVQPMAADGTIGKSTTITAASLATKTITVKNGLITDFA